MKRLILLGALALTTTAQAQVVVRAPGVYVEVGPAVIVRAWGVEVFVPRRAAKPLPPAAVPPMKPVGVAPAAVDPSVPPVPKEEDLLLPSPIPVPGTKEKVPVTPVALTRAVTLGEFVASAKPFKPGVYDVMLLHPYTNKPVKVSFELPVAPRRVSVTKTRIEFRWGVFKGMDLQFEPDGTVRVKG